MSLKRPAPPSPSEDESRDDSNSGTFSDESFEEKGSFWLSNRMKDFKPIKLGWGERQFPAFASGIHASLKARLTEYEKIISWEYLYRFLDFGLFEDYKIPKVEVEGLEDPIAFPLCGLQADALKSLCQPAKYTEDGEPTLDTDVRNSWEIKCENIKLDSAFFKCMQSQASSCISAMMGFPVNDEEIVLKLNKMMLYETGGFFKMHQDRKREPAHFATFIVVLPSVHTGGDVNFSFGGESRTCFASDEHCEKLQYACFFLDILHAVSDVTSGRRLVLLFHLCYKEGSNLALYLKPGPQNMYGVPLMPLRGD